MMAINQKLIFETKVTTSAAFGWFSLPCAENDILEMPTRSMCQRASCTSGRKRCTQTVKSKGNQNTAWSTGQSVNEDL